MSNKHVPANVFLKCDKGVTPCRLQILRPGPSLYDEKWAVESDAIPVINVSTFGVCAITQTPCVPATVRWQNALMGSTKVVAMGLPQNPLMDDSFLPCAVGGKIDIFFTRAAVTQAMQADENAQQAEEAKKVAAEAKAKAGLLFFAAIAVAVVVVVATGGAALPLVAAAAATGAAVGGTVGAVAGGMEGYAHGGGALGAVKGAAQGLAMGAIFGAVGGAAAVAGGPVAVGLMQASGALFAGATAADAFAFYKQPTLDNGLVLASDLAIMFGGKVIEGRASKLVEARAKGGKALETPAGAAKKKCTTAGDPVDVASGAMLFDAVDFTLPGPIPLVWERTWYSTSERKGPLGHGWHHRYDLALAVDPETGTVAMRLDDGRLALFELPGPDNEYYAYYRPRQLELRPLPDGADGYAVHSLAEGITYRFTPTAHLTGHYALAAVEDGHGHALRFDYTAQGHLHAMTDSAGRPIGVRTDPAGRILALDLPRPDGTPGTFAAVQYAYDEAGNMTRVIDAEGHAMRFAYRGHLLVQKTFATGMSFYFTYDAARRCTRTWGDEGYYDCRFAYAPDHTSVHLAEPAATDTYYHERGLVTLHLNALGQAHHRRYNAHDELEAEQDALGHTTSYEYDGQGNLTGITHPDGATEHTQYDERGHLLARTNAAGSTWQWAYNEAGHLSERTDPLGATTHYRYDEQGRVNEVRDALGHATRLRYDAQHNLAHIVSPDEHVRSRTYDALGRVVQLTDVHGNHQHRRYDRLGQLVAVREPDGRETVLAYNGDGEVVRARDAEQEVEFAYTAVNRLAVRRQAGHEVRFAYDRQARLTGLTNEHGETYRFGLDAAGRVVAEEGFDGLVRRYAHDAAGRVTTVHRPAGRTTAYAYDPAGRVAEVVHNDGTSEQYTYDATGALQEARTATATATVRLERDVLGRVVREHQGAHTVTSAYDARGQRTALGSSLGAAFAWQHDAMGNVAAAQAGDGWQAQFQHDARGLELQRTLSGGVQQRWQRDIHGRPTRQQLTGPDGGRQRHYEWQGADQLAAVNDSLLGQTRYRYDARGHLTEAAYADGTHELRLPDAVGNLFRSPTQQDRRYGKGGQLRQAGGTRYQYDAEGNLTRKTTPAGEAWQYAWNGAGQLTGVTRPDGYAVTFAYDALGRRISKRYRGRVTKWVWDGDKPLHEWTELEVGPGAGHAEDLATWLFDEDSFAPAAKFTVQGRYSIVTDHLGTPLTMYDERGQQTWEMALDSYGQVRQGQGKPRDCPFRYQGQYEDTETGLYYNRFRYYSPEEGMYISQDPIRLAGGKALYGYSSSPLTRIDPFGLEGIVRWSGESGENWVLISQTHGKSLFLQTAAL